MRAAAWLFLALISVLAAFTVTSHNAALAALTMFVWGVISFALVSPLQMRVIDVARGAPNLVSTLNQGAFNIGCGAGAWFGGLALRLGAGYDETPWVGVAIAMVGLALTVVSMSLDRRLGAAAASAC